MPFICRSTKSCPTTDAWSRAPSTGLLGGQGTTSPELAGAACTTGNAKIELNTANFSSLDMFLCRSSTRNFSGSLPSGQPRWTMNRLLLSQEGETHVEDGSPSSPLTRFPSWPHPDFLATTGRPGRRGPGPSLQPCSNSECKVLEQIGEENLQKLGESF